VLPIKLRRQLYCYSYFYRQPENLILYS